MTDKFVVAYDGSPASERAVRFAVDEAKRLDASVIVVHVIEWLPYSFLTVEENEQRHKRRTEEMDLARKSLLEPVSASLADSGVEIEIVIRDGQVTQSLVDLIKQKKATQLFLGRTGQNGLSRLVFGSVVSNMAQVAPVPCTIVP